MLFINQVVTEQKSTFPRRILFALQHCLRENKRRSNLCRMLIQRHENLIPFSHFTPHHILTSPTKLGCISPSSGGVSGAAPLPLKLPLLLKQILPFLPPNSSNRILLLPRSSSSLSVPTSSSFSFHILSTACLSFSMRRSSSIFSLRIKARTASRPAFAAASS
jgi:hypothetical protein